MATAKKKSSTTKKTPAKKAPAKKPAAKSAAARTTTKRKTASKKAQMKSFRLCRDEQSFMTFQVTRQTIYWLIIAVIAMCFTAWVLVIQNQIHDLYNEIEQMQIEEAALTVEIMEAEARLAAEES